MARTERRPWGRVAESPRLLVLGAGGVGSFCSGVPALRALRRAFPRHHLVLAAPSRLALLVPLADAVDELLPTTGVDPLPWHGPSPAVAVNLSDRGPQGHVLLHTLWPSRTIAYASLAAPGGVEGPAWEEGEHEVTRWCRLLGSFGITADPSDLALRRPPGRSVAPAAVVIHPGAGEDDRRWPPRRFAEVAHVLASTGRDVVVTGGRSEVELAQSVADAAGLGGSAVLAGSLHLGGLAALVADASLVLSGDTGIARLAWAYGTPSVTVLGPRPPSEVGPPPGRDRHVVCWHGRSAVVGAPPGAAVERVTAVEVLAAASRLLPRVVPRQRGDEVSPAAARTVPGRG